MSRRLPIYIAVDVSESMAGEPLEQMESVIDHVLSDLRRDPHALETVWLSQIAFAGKPMMLSNLTELVSFIPASLPLGGGTGIGALLRFLMKTLDSNRQVDIATGKSDWKPVIYLMTDGRSTDSTTAEIATWNSKYRSKCTLVAISIGDGADLNLLRSFTDNVLIFMDSSPDAYSQFAQWISRSISRSITVASTPLLSLEKPHVESKPGVIEPANEYSDKGHKPDTATIVVVGRCQVSKKPYLLRYGTSAQSKGDSSGSHLPFQGSLPLKESYFELSSADSLATKIDVTTLEHPGRCVHCGADHAAVICDDCKKISCGRNDQPWQCPWCGLVGSLGQLKGSAFTERGLG